MKQSLQARLRLAQEVTGPPPFPQKLVRAFLSLTIPILHSSNLSSGVCDGRMLKQVTEVVWRQSKKPPTTLSGVWRQISTHSHTLQRQYAGCCRGMCTVKLWMYMCLGCGVVAMRWPCGGMNEEVGYYSADANVTSMT